MQGNTKYTRGAGSMDLCQAVADYLLDKHQIETVAENVVITPGAKQALLYSFMITTMPGEEVHFVSTIMGFVRTYVRTHWSGSSACSRKKR